MFTYISTRTGSAGHRQRGPELPACAEIPSAPGGASAGGKGKRQLSRRTGDPPSGYVACELPDPSASSQKTFKALLLAQRSPRSQAFGSRSAPCQVTVSLIFEVCSILALPTVSCFQLVWYICLSWTLPELSCVSHNLLWS